MFLWNTTRYETELLRRLVRAGFGPVPTGRLLIRVRRGREALSAMSYDFVPELPDIALPRSVRDYVVLRVGPTTAFPCSGRYPGLRGAPDFRVRCWHEAVLVLAAHEAGHVEVFRRRRGALHRLARGGTARIARDSELACERRALRALRRFRAQHRCGLRPH